MFAYCRNNPVNRIDVSGFTDQSFLDDNPVDEEDLLEIGKGSGAVSGFSPANAIKTGTSNSGSSNTPSSGNGGNNGNSQVVPQNAIDTLNYIQSHNSTPPNGYQGGGIFANDGRNGSQILPTNDAPYREYDIYPKIQGVSRGSERIVIGHSGTAWYTRDHYISFTRIE